MTTKMKQKSVDAFQENPRLGFVGNILSAGVGIPTEGTVVIFNSFD
jgi:uncharacterized protein YvpB